ncbi:MAG: hypothetical protein EAZ97_15930 [Bacteroidetes bacterium]|nr:MAG: hypothetical protein EAZ97_15930 [Bacteroidota bacterium]
MEIFLFFLKTIGINAVGLALFAAISGKISTIFNPDHAHAMMPTWMVYGGVGLVLGAIIGLGTAVFMYFKQTTDLTLVLKVLGVACVLVAGLIIYFTIRSR